MEVDYTYRIGNKTENKTRQIVVGILTLERKRAILKNIQNLQNLYIIISKDYSKKVLEKMKELPILKE